MKKAAAFAAAIMLGTSLTGCLGQTKTYTEYIQAVLDCTYFGKTEKYMELTEATQEEADAVYQDEITYVAELLCYQFAVESDYVSEETLDGYEALAEDLIGKVKYTVDDAVASGDAYHITVNCEPMNFWDDAYTAAEEYYTGDFGTKYENATTEEELIALEEEYAVEVLDILSGYIASTGYGEPVKKIVEITVDDDGLYGIEDQDWLDIDDLVLGIEGV